MIADSWGVRADERTRQYPCDDLVTDPVLEVWRGVTVRAPSAQVWPWVAQIRLAPYSYDWIDNLGHRSPRSLRGLAEPRPGEPFTAVGGRPVGHIASVTAGQELTGTILGAVMSYVLVPEHARATRLLLKVVMERGRLVAPLVAVGDLVMARRQLLTLARLAESAGAPPPDRRRQ